MKRADVRRGALFLAVAFAGCGDPSGVEDSELTETEAHALIAAAMFATLDVTSVLPAAPEGSTAASQNDLAWTADFEAEVRCPGGGEVALAASLVVRERPTGASRRAEYRLVEVPSGCVVPVEGGPRFALWGGPRMNVTVAVEHDAQDRRTLGGSVSGDVDWEIADRRGSCAIALDVSGRVDPDGRTAQFRGTACGFAVDRAIALY